MLPTAQGSEDRLFVCRLVPTEQSNIKKQAPRRMMPKEFKVSSDSLDKCIIFLRPIPPVNAHGIGKKGRADRKIAIRENSAKGKRCLSTQIKLFFLSSARFS
jgi:hypothetical protein